MAQYSPTRNHFELKLKRNKREGPTSRLTEQISPFCLLRKKKQKLNKRKGRTLQNQKTMEKNDEKIRATVFQV